LHHAAHQIVVQLKKFVGGRLRGVRPQQRTAGRFRQLRSDAKLPAETQQRSRQHNIHFGLACDFLQVDILRGILRRNERRTHHEVIQTSEGNSDSLGQAINQKFYVVAGSQ
jgi:hypothetical protein